MRKLLAALPLITGLSFAQYFDGDVVREFGVKTGLVKVKYNSIDGTEPDKTLEEFFSVYGYMGARTTAGFTAGASVELSTGSKMTRNRTIIYTALELNPAVELNLSENLRAHTGFGGSINRFKERAGGRTNEDTNFGLQFFLGAKLNLTPTFGLLGEYKGKIFMTGDYDGDVVHHLNLGLFFLIH